MGGWRGGRRGEGWGEGGANVCGGPGVGVCLGGPRGRGSWRMLFGFESGGGWV